LLIGSDEQRTQPKEDVVDRTQETNAPAASEPRDKGIQPLDPAIANLMEEGAAFTHLTGGAAMAPKNGSGHSGPNPNEPARTEPSRTERFPVVVVGAGQAGLSVGYHLLRLGIRFVILDESPRVGDAWRRRWDSLRLFSPARYDGLDGMRFPARGDSYPTKDEMGDYLESYAERFSLPVRTGVRVDRITKEGDRFIVCAGDARFVADQVVMAMSSYQDPYTPSFARELSPDIVQLHSSDYRNPSQLQEGDVLLVGAGNSGAEIALELARKGHGTWMCGRDTGHVPFRIEGWFWRMLMSRLVLRVVFHRILTMATPIGRKVRLQFVTKGGPLVRTKPKDLAEAGVHRALRMTGVKNGLPVLDDSRVLPVRNVIWCTGFRNDFTWIDVPTFDEEGAPIHVRGRSKEPGLYFVGLSFLYSVSSTMVHGVGRDAQHVAEEIAANVRAHAA